MNETLTPTAQLTERETTPISKCPSNKTNASNITNKPAKNSARLTSAPRQAFQAPPCASPFTLLPVNMIHPNDFNRLTRNKGVMSRLPECPPVRGAPTRAAPARRLPARPPHPRVRGEAAELHILCEDRDSEPGVTETAAPLPLGAPSASARLSAGAGGSG